MTNEANNIEKEPATKSVEIVTEVVPEGELGRGGLKGQICQLTDEVQAWAADAAHRAEQVVELERKREEIQKKAERRGWAVAILVILLGIACVFWRGSVLKRVELEKDNQRLENNYEVVKESNLFYHRIVGNRDAVISHKRHEIADLEGLTVNQAATIDEQKSVIADQKAKNEYQEIRIGELQNELTTRDAEVADLKFLIDDLEYAVADYESLLEEWNEFWARREARLQTQRFSVDIVAGIDDIQIVEEWLTEHGFTEPLIDRYPSGGVRYTVVLDGEQLECFNALLRASLVDTKVDY